MAGDEAKSPRNSKVVTAVVSNTAISLDTALAAVAAEECGAVVSFSGVVRNHDGRPGVLRLDYSAHPSANGVIEDIAAEVAGMYDGVRLWAAHRVGELKVGDAALVAAASAAHRGDAFDACRDLVEGVKFRLPIWKEQFFEDGDVEWVGIGVNGQADS
jgi:molybdopterin synthase catalytic subunit